jgi:hypothetical protein
MARNALVGLLAVGANAEWDTCMRPKGKFIAIDQGNGRSYVNSITYLGSMLIGVGSAYGNMSFSSNHVVNGTHGETLDHEAVVTHHETGTFAGGRYDNAASSQLGMDSVIYEITTDGVPGRVYAIDTMPSDGKTDGSENGRSLGYSYLDSVATFEASGDATSIVAAGTFRGNLTIPINSVGNTSTVNDATTVLCNRKNGDYDGFVVKIDSSSMTGIWAVAPSQTAAGRNYARRVATAADGKVFVTSDIRPSRSYIGRLIVLDGTDGSTLVTQELTGASSMYGLSAAGNYAYIGGQFEGESVDPFGTGTAMTSANGGSSSSGFVAKMGTDGVGLWAVSIGSRTRSTTTSPDGAHVYAVGQISNAWTSGACSLTGTDGGFVIKLAVADGSCVWAKDTGGDDSMKAVAADASSVYTLGNADVGVTFGTSYEVFTAGSNNDFVVSKLNAADGAGLWATSVGGNDGSEYGYAISAGAAGVAISGWLMASSIDFFGVTLANLQASRAGGSARAGIIGMIDMTGRVPSCLSDCTTTTTAATVASGQCYAGDRCYGDGDSDAFRSCFMCDAAASRTTMQGPITTNHCYISGVCRDTGARAPAYQRYNEESICEVCNPSVNPTGWSLQAGFIHDRNIATTQSGRFRRGTLDPTANAFNMIFDSGSNGCQVLPGLMMPATLPAGVTSGYAAAALTSLIVSGTLAAAAVSVTAMGPPASMQATIERAIAGTGEFSGISEAGRKAYVDTMAQYTMPVSILRAQLVDTNLATWQAAWAWYNGDSSTCTKQAGDSRSVSANHVCANTPAATAETHATLFSTHLHYGSAIANVKSKQAMSLGAANAEASSPDGNLATAFKLDTEMQMMIPAYQGLLEAARSMDIGASGPAAAGRAYAYYTLIQPMLLASAREEAMMVASMVSPNSPSTAGTNDTFCAVSNLLANHLPNASALVYTGTHGTSATAGLAYPHETALSAQEATELTHFDYEEHVGSMPHGADAVICQPFSQPSLQPATHKAVFAVTASGDPTDYTDEVVDAIQVKLAVEANVDPRRVAITVEAGSVILTIQINYTTAADADTGAAQLTSLLADTAAASVLLSTPAMTITVSSIDTRARSSSMNPSSSTGLSTTALIIIIAGAVVIAILLLLLIVCSCKRKNEGKPIFLCLDDAKQEKEKKMATSTAS